MQQILVSALVFTVIILILATLVLAVRRWLGFSGQATLSLDDGRVFPVGAGRKLLWVLSDLGIYLPSACGGKGACGQCRVRILEGAPEISQMGREHINPVDAAAGDRLACMVRMWDDLLLSVPQVGGDVSRWECTVVSNQSVSVYLKELILRLPENERITFQAGDYVQVEVPPYQLPFRDLEIAQPYVAEWQRLGLLDLESRVGEATVRAYSLANPPAEDQEIRLVIRIATPPASAPKGTPPGRASSYLFSLSPGDTLPVFGPFGTFHASDNDREMVLIAGGAGIAPIRSIILDRFRQQPGRKMSLWYGARDLHDLVYFEELEKLADVNENFTVQAVLSNPRESDHWEGPSGFVHSVVRQKYLSRHPAPGEVEYYLCGPPLMAAAVLQMLDDVGVARENIFLDDFGS